MYYIIREIESVIEDTTIIKGNIKCIAVYTWLMLNLEYSWRFWTVSLDRYTVILFLSDTVIPAMSTMIPKAGTKS